MDGLKPRLQRSIRLGEQMFACFAAKTGLKTHKNVKFAKFWDHNVLNTGNWMILPKIHCVIRRMSHN